MDIAGPPDDEQRLLDKLDSDPATEVHVLAAIPVTVGKRVLVDVLGAQMTVTLQVG